jgi:hypothetical protein
MPNPSFFFAIFKRLQACGNRMASMTSSAGAAGHFTTAGVTGPAPTGDLSGGFSLTHPSDPNGIFGSISSTLANPAALANHSLLAMNDPAPGNNPIYAVLNACSSNMNPTPPTSTSVGGSSWPTMPYYCDVTGGSNNPAWQEFGKDTVTALGAWIQAGKVNDEPQGRPGHMAASPLYFPTLNPGLIGQSGPRNPSLPINSPWLFVCSMAGDNGVRPGAPNNFWATSQIYLMQTNGVVLTRTPDLYAGAEYYVAAAIGNSGTACAGRLPPPQGPSVLATTIKLEAWAMAFGTGYTPATQLPPLSNLKASSSIMYYEQYCMPQQLYDVVGFRFDVSSVFTQLANELVLMKANLGQMSPEQWVAASHPCVKVFFTQGGQYYQSGGQTAPTLASSPLTDGGIAQKNLSSFQIPVPAQAIKWTHFMVAQAPIDSEGVNRLKIDHDLPPSAFRFLLAMPTQPFERYVRKAGGLGGFEVARDVGSKPFPDAVILREMTPGSLLEIAGHAREPFLGMSLGVEYDATRLAPGRIGSVSVVHFTRENEVFGGCTIEIEMAGDR